MNNEQEALSAAARYCSGSEHCRSDVVGKLTRYDLDPEQVERILTRLEQDGFLDEGRYANAFARDKFRFSGWGRLKIRQALREKKVADQHIDEALANLPESDYTDTLLRLLRQKDNGLKASSPYERKGKLFRFAAGRGFEPDLVGRLLGHLNLPDNDD